MRLSGVLGILVYGATAIDHSSTSIRLSNSLLSSPSRNRLTKQYSVHGSSSASKDLNSVVLEKKEDSTIQSCASSMENSTIGTAFISREDAVIEDTVIPIKPERGGGGSILVLSKDELRSRKGISISPSIPASKLAANNIIRTKAAKNTIFRKKKERQVDPKSSAAVYSKKLKNRNSMNIKRKLTHAAFGLFFAALNQIIPKSKFVPGMAFITSLTLFVELLRYKKGFGWMNDALHFVLGSSLRKHEMEGKFTGSYYYFLGVTCTSALFSTTSATLGIIQLAIADPAASYFGRKTRDVYWSRIDKGFFGLGRNKGILGFLGGAVACVPINYVVLNTARWNSNIIPGGKLYLLAASFGLGLAGAFADLAVPTPALCVPPKIMGVPVPPFHLDDNFVVPVVSGFACTQIFNSFGWSALELANFFFL